VLAEGPTSAEAGCRHVQVSPGTFLRSQGTPTADYRQARPTPDKGAGWMTQHAQRLPSNSAADIHARSSGTTAAGCSVQSELAAGRDHKGGETSRRNRAVLSTEKRRSYHGLTKPSNRCRSRRASAPFEGASAVKAHQQPPGPRSCIRRWRSIRFCSFAISRSRRGGHKRFGRLFRANCRFTPVRRSGSRTPELRSCGLPIPGESTGSTDRSSL